MKRILSLILFTGILFAMSGMLSQTNADCQAIYGGGQTCTTDYTFTVNKMVQVPGKGGGNYVDNLSINDVKFNPSQNVNFQFTITNTGSQTIPSLNVVDTLPQFLSFVSGPGNYNANNKTLSLTVNNLEAGKSVNYVITAKTADTNTLPNNQGIICVLNQVSATDTNGETNSDSSQVCIQKPVLAAVVPVKVTPPTGPEMLPLALLIPGGLSGLMLRKRSKDLMNKGGEK